MEYSSELVLHVVKPLIIRWPYLSPYTNESYTTQGCALLYPDSKEEFGQKVIYYPNKNKNKIFYNSLYIAISNGGIVQKLMNIGDFAIVHFSDLNEQYIKMDKTIQEYKSLMKSFISFEWNNEIKLYLPGSLLYDFGIGEEYYIYNINNKQDKNAIFEYVQISDAYNFVFPSIDVIANKITEILMYVKHFDFNKIASTYKVVKSGWLKNRPGKDDHFITETKRYLDTEDEYIRSLFPLENTIGYYACYGRGIDDEDYDNKIDTCAIEESITEARNKYKKKQHYSILISSYFKWLYESKYKDEIFQRNIDKIFNYKSIESKFQNYRPTFASQPNESWVNMYNLYMHKRKSNS